MYILLFLYFQGHLFGFLWRLLPFEMNKRKWSCFFARSVTSRPLNSPSKTILLKVWVHKVIQLYAPDPKVWCKANLVQRLSNDRGGGDDISLPEFTIRPCALRICSGKYPFSQICTPSQNIIHWTVQVLKTAKIEHELVQESDCTAKSPLTSC